MVPETELGFSIRQFLMKYENVKKFDLFCMHCYVTIQEINQVGFNFVLHNDSNKYSVQTQIVTDL